MSNRTIGRVLSDARAGITSDDTRKLLLCTIEALDNVSASLETVMAHYGSYMPSQDKIGREKVLNDARRLLRSDSYV